jgi:hypothetical protein
MNRAWRTRVVALLATSFVLLLGCGGGNDGPVSPNPGGSVVVTGRVTEVHDMVPVDGGATITVATQGGGTENLLFPSLYTDPPPSQQTIDLYDVVRRVKSGDWIRAEGKRTADGIALKALVILGEQP